MITPLMCMVTALYFEARSEPEIEQYKVAEVIMNRVNSSKFPDTICGVVKHDRGPKAHDCQFSFYCDGKSEVIEDLESFENLLQISMKVIIGAHDNILPEETLWYHTDDVKPLWSNKLQPVNNDGKHIFYVKG